MPGLLEYAVAFYIGGMLGSAVFFAWLSLIVYTLDIDVFAPWWSVVMYLVAALVLWPLAPLYVMWMLATGGLDASMRAEDRYE